jgi:hypothetical protein
MVVQSSTGGDATLPAATTELAGLMPASAVAALANAETGGAAAAAMAAHLAAADAHPGYTTPAEAAAAAPVQSVALSVPSGWSASSANVGGSVTLTLALPTGYSLPSNISQANWDTAYSERARWDGASSGLNAATGRTSLGLGTAATTDATAYATAAQGAKADAAVQPSVLSGYIQTSDSRLADSREWNASTATQAEAEAGTSTDRLAFSPLRIFQAIAAWWSNSSAASKLSGIASGATANSSDAYLLSRDNHTGTQSISTITGLGLLTADGSGNLTLSGRLTNTFSSLASASAKLFSGTWFTGGTSTTTKPHVLIEPTGATSTGWSTSGTGFGINALSGFTGNLLDLQVNGSSVFSAAPVNGGVTLQSSGPAAGNFLTIRQTRGVVSTAAYISLLGGAGQVNDGIVLAPVGTPILRVYGNSGVFRVEITSTTGLNWNNDTWMCRDASNVVALRNLVAGSNGQTFRVYRTYTDANNYERVALILSDNTFRFGPEAAGTGTPRPLYISTGSTTVPNLPSPTTVGAGSRSFVTDATSTVFLSIVVGGGTNKVPVVTDGTNWLIG